MWPHHTYSWNEVHQLCSIKILTRCCRNSILITNLSCRPKGRQELFSAFVSVWTESHKIWIRISKIRALINQVLTWCFPSYRVCLTSQIIKSVGINKSVNFNQSIWMNQFYQFEASNLIIIWYFQLTWEELVIRGKKHNIA